MSSSSRINRRLSLQPTSTTTTHHSNKNITNNSSSNSTRVYKLLLLGAGSVGKTQLVNRFLSTPFTSRYHRTVEELHVLESPGLRLEIMDTAGSYEFPAMRNLNIINSDGYLVVFDVGDDGGGSMEEASSLLSLINQHKSKPSITIAANKIDLLNLQDLESLSNNELYNQLLADYNLVQTSALTGDGCDKLWKLVLGELNYLEGVVGEKLRRVSVGEVLDEKHSSSSGNHGNKDQQCVVA